MGKTILSTSFWLAVSSVGVHFFCCGIPLISSVMAILGVGVTAFHSPWEAFIEIYQWPISAFSGIMLLLGWWGVLKAEGLCGHGGCPHNHKKHHNQHMGKYVLAIITILFTINIFANLYAH